VPRRTTQIRCTATRVFPVVRRSKSIARRRV
jgi:hypothetical protein